VLGLGLSTLLAALAIAVFPCWRHSARWGYGPSMTAAGLLILVAALTVGGKSVAEDSRISRMGPPPETLPVEPPAHIRRLAELAPP